MRLRANGPRWLFVAAGLIAAAIFGVVGFATVGGPPGPAHPGGPAEVVAARPHALEACRQVGLLLADLRANARRDRVDRDLATATSEAETAAALDPGWRPLAGGIEAVAKGLNDNDPNAAGTGMDVVRAGCPDIPSPPAGSPIPAG